MAFYPKIYQFGSRLTSFFLGNLPGRFVFPRVHGILRLGRIHGLWGPLLEARRDDRSAGAVDHELRRLDLTTNESPTLAGEPEVMVARQAFQVQELTFTDGRVVGALKMAVPSSISSNIA